MTISIYDVLGQRVRTLVDREFAAGRHHVEWDGRDDRGQHRASGVYFYRLIAGDAVLDRKMVIVK